VNLTLPWVRQQQVQHAGLLVAGHNSSDRRDIAVVEVAGLVQPSTESRRVPCEFWILDPVLVSTSGRSPCAAPGAEHPAVRLDVVANAEQGAAGAAELPAPRSRSQHRRSVLAGTLTVAVPAPPFGPRRHADRRGLGRAGPPGRSPAGAMTSQLASHTIDPVSLGWDDNPSAWRQRLS
jgi:hypothetical protein